MMTKKPYYEITAWLGRVGPGPSYLDPGSGGPENNAKLKIITGLQRHR